MKPVVVDSSGLPLKRQFHENFEVVFFHQTAYSGPCRGILWQLWFLKYCNKCNLRGVLYDTISCHDSARCIIDHRMQSWALAVYFQVRSPLISFPWIAIALALIWPIFRFAHRSIALRKPVVRSRKRALKRKIAPKTTAVRSVNPIIYVFFSYHILNVLPSWINIFQFQFQFQFQFSISIFNFMYV